MRAAAILASLFIAGCTGTAAAPAGDAAKAKPDAAPVAAAAAPAEALEAPTTGTVVETMDAGQYTYVRLKTPKGDIWAAVTQQPLKAGSEITIGNAMWMQNFESKTLNRKFEHILFGSIVAPGGAMAAELPAGHVPVTQAAGGAPSSEILGDVKVEKAAGGKTVAEIYASKATLKGTEVVVRGTVVKWNPEIMGKNWLHLRDGSGSADKGDNDLTVTTTDVVTKGSVVTVRGKLGLDRDFTSGYAYPVILEDAKVIK